MFGEFLQEGAYKDDGLLAEPMLKKALEEQEHPRQAPDHKKPMLILGRHRLAVGLPAPLSQELVLRVPAGGRLQG